MGHKIQKDLGIKDIYNYYVSTYKNTVDYDTFRSFLFGSNNARKKTDRGVISELRYQMLNKAYACILGRRLGILQIKKKKSKIRLTSSGDIDFKGSGMSVDWKATNRYWEHNPEAKEKKTRIFYKNEHTHGYKMRVFWDKRTSNVKNKIFYKFQPVRDLNRNLAKVIFSNHRIDYYEF